MVKKLGIVLCCVACTVGVQAATTKDFANRSDLKIRWFDAQKVQDTKLAQEKSTEFQSFGKERGTQIQNKQAELQKLAEEYNAKQSTLSEEARKAEEKKLAQMKAEYDAFLRASEQEVQRAMAKMSEELVKELEDAATKIAKRDKIDVILDSASGRVVYVSDNAKVTNDLVKEMDKAYDLKLVKNNTVKKDADKTVVASNTASSKATPAKKAVTA